MIQIIKTKIKLKSAIRQPMESWTRLELLNLLGIVRPVRLVGRAPELRIPMNPLQTSTSTTLCPLTLLVAATASLSPLWSKALGTLRLISWQRLTRVQAWASRREPISDRLSNNSEIARAQGPDSSHSAVSRRPPLRQRKLPLENNARFKWKKQLRQRTTEEWLEAHKLHPRLKRRSQSPSIWPGAIQSFRWARSPLAPVLSTSARSSAPLSRSARCPASWGKEQRRNRRSSNRVLNRQTVALTILSVLSSQPPANSHSAWTPTQMEPFRRWPKCPRLRKRQSRALLFVIVAA